MKQLDKKNSINSDSDIHISQIEQPNDLSVHWEFVNMIDELFGLVRFSLNLFSAKLKNCVLNLELLSDEGDFLQKKIMLSHDGICVVNFILHTHVYKNGSHFIDIIITDNNNVKVWQDKATFFIKNKGKIAEKITVSLLKNKVPFFIDGFCDSSFYDYKDATLYPWFDRPDALEIINKWKIEGDITDDEFYHFRQFIIDGYMIYDNLIDDKLITSVNKEIDLAIAKGYQGYQDGSSQRLTHLHNIYPNIRKLFLDRRYLDVVEKIFQSRANPCQSLTYINGSQQDAHQDTIHLTSFPAGYMCGVWIALEDIKPDSGELEVYPKSHKLSRIYMDTVKCNKVKNDWGEFATKVVQKWHDAINSTCLNKVTYRPSKGTVLIWHENLMHAGSIRRNIDLTRRSIVFHCFAEGTIVYYDSTGEVGYVINPAK